MGSCDIYCKYLISVIVFVYNIVVYNLELIYNLLFLFEIRLYVYRWYKGDFRNLYKDGYVICIKSEFYFIFIYILDVNDNINNV